MAPQALCHLLPSSSPARLLPLLPFFFFFISVAICSSAGAVPQGERHVGTKITEEIENQYLKKPPVYDTSEHDSENESKPTEQAASSDGRNDCYALEFSKNMSTLLSEASHMIGRVKSSRERNWLKAFIRRLTLLTDDLLEHPEVRKSKCLRNQTTKSSRDKSEKDWNSKSKNTIIKNHMLLEQKNIPARRSHIPDHVEVENPSKLLLQNQSTLITKPETNQGDFVTEEMSKIDGGNKLDNSDDLVQQLRIGPPGITDSTVPQQEHPHGMIDVKVWNSPKVTHESTSVGSSKRIVTSPQSTTLKDDILQKLLDEMASQVQKLKDLGGTEEDMLNLWKENGPKTPLPVVEVTPSPEVEQDIPDFGYDEQGAATGELRPDDSQQDLIVAPSVNKVVSTMSSIPIVSSSSGLEVMNEFYPTSKPALDDKANDEDDDLVRQLQEEKFLSEAAPKSVAPDHLYPEKDSQSDTTGGVPFKNFRMGHIFG